jgi:Domain of unknown function (DUF5060)/Protein of unknown function (DUF4038)
MTRLLLSLLGLILRLLALAELASAQTSTTCNNTPAYSPCELVFELSDRDAAAHPNPYATVELRAEVRSPRNRTTSIPGYWDGGRRMVVRFAPTEGGQWVFRLLSNVAGLNDHTGTFTASDSDAPGFIRAANLHHWSYTERQKPHLWMGATELRFAFMDDAAFHAMADARAAQKFNHLRGWVTGDGADAAYTAPDSPNLEQFRKLDERVRYLSQKGITTDLVLAGGEGTLTKLFPKPEQRRRFVSYAVARYAAMNVTWQVVEYFEDYPDARALLNEIGTALKELDGFQHPRSCGARITSAPLLDDGWMDFAAYGNTDDNVGAVEHQLYAVPSVNLQIGGADGAAVRHALWNATMDGQYVTLAQGATAHDGADAKAMSLWFDVLTGTRHWELEPYFDLDGGRALALEGTEYLAYIEKPGPLEMTVEKHGYDVFWIDPATGETVRKKFSGDHFTGAPPDQSHDWVLHIVREGTLQSMNREYKFESREIALQELEANPQKIPYDIVSLGEELSLDKSAPYAVKLTRQTRGTRTMMYLWTGEVTADHQGYRVLGTGAQGAMRATSRLAINFPAIVLLRVYGMNANGKVYLLTKAVQLDR